MSAPFGGSERREREGSSFPDPRVEAARTATFEVIRIAGDDGEIMLHARCQYRYDLTCVARVVAIASVGNGYHIEC